MPSRVAWTRLAAAPLRSMAFLGVVFLLGCDASSNDARSTAGDAGRHDAGPDIDVSAPDAASKPDGATTCTPFGTPECARGQTCCLTGFTGTCEELSACTTTTQFQCGLSRDCAPTELCCGTFVDLPNGPTATTFCSSSCAAPSHEVCMTSNNCTGADVCTVLPEGTNSPILAAAVEVFSVCLPPDGGATP